MKKKPSWKRIMRLIAAFGRYVEAALAIIILIVIVLSIIKLMMDLTQMSINDLQTGFFTSFLSKILTLAVGVEFVRMLCKHTADTIVDVLLFATARQMVVEHLDPLQTLLCVLAIGGLFAIRKYLLLSSRHQQKDEAQDDPGALLDMDISDDKE